MSVLALITGVVKFLLLGIWLGLVAGLEGAALRRSGHRRKAVAFWTVLLLSGFLAVLELLGRGPVWITELITALFSPGMNWLRLWLGA